MRRVPFVLAALHYLGHFYRVRSHLLHALETEVHVVVFDIWLPAAAHADIPSLVVWTTPTTVTYESVGNALFLRDRLDVASTPLHVYYLALREHQNAILIDAVSLQPLGRVLVLLLGAVDTPVSLTSKVIVVGKVQLYAAICAVGPNWNLHCCDCQLNLVIVLFLLHNRRGRLVLCFNFEVGEVSLLGKVLGRARRANRPRSNSSYVI